MGNTLQEIFARLSGQGQDMPPDMQNALETPDLGPGGGVALGGTGGGGSAPPGFKGAPLPRRGGLTQQQIQLPGGGFETESQAQNQVPDTSGLTLDTTSTPSSIHQPGFLSALTSAPPGTPVTANPQLSTKGKVLAALVGIGQGALAGYAAGQQGNPRQGYGGFGAGFDAGSQLSFIQSYRRQQQQEAQLQQKIQQWKLEQEQQNQPIQRQQQAATLAQTQASTQKDIQQTQNLANAPDKLPDLQHLYAQAVQSGNMAQAQKYADAIQAIQKEPTPKTPNRDDEAIRIQGKDPKTWTQPEKDFMRGYNAWVQATKVQPGMARAQVFVQGRAVQTEDPETGAKYYEPAGEAMRKGSIAGSTNLQKNAFTPAARIKDVERVSSGIESSVDALDQGNAQKALIANALTDPANTTASQFAKSKIASQLSPKSRDYVTNVLSMREQIMGLNQLLTGSSGTSDSRIKAIWDTLPNGSEPDSDMGRRKMKLVRGMIGNVKQAFPMMQMIPGGQDSSGQGQATHIYDPATGTLKPIQSRQ